MKLTSEQEHQIRKFVENKELKVGSLRDDIIDHLCSEVELRLKTGATFEQALNDAVKELAPNGLKEIDQQTLDLLNGKSIGMKRITYVLGFLGSFILVSSFSFHILHLPNASVVTIIGFVLLLLFVPLWAYDRFTFMKRRTRLEMTKIVLGTIAGLIYLTGVLLKLLHLPGAGIFLASSIFLLAGFVPFLFLSMYKKSIAS